MRRITLLILFLNTLCCYSQQSLNTDSLFRIFKDDVMIEQNEYSGKVVFDKDTKKSFFTLLANSSTEDLLNYINDDIAFIRSNIFVYLLQKRISDSVISEILEIHKNDTTRFTVQGECVVTDWSVINYMKFAAKLKETNTLNYIDYKSAIEKLRESDVMKIKIDGIRHGIVDKRILLDVDCLELSIEEIKVSSFSLFVGEQEFKSLSCNLTREMKTSIEKAESGEIIYFTNVKVKFKDDNIRQINSLILKLK